MQKACLILLGFALCLVAAIPPSSEAGVAASRDAFRKAILDDVGVAVNWGAFQNPILDHDGAVLKDGCLIQLVWDADGDGIDEPGEGGIPSGGDELLDVSYTRQGSFFPGKFSNNTTLGNVGVGERIYVRAWNAETVKNATYYGDTRLVQPSLWSVGNSMRMALDATEGGSWCTAARWSLQGVLLWRLERTYSAELLQNHPNPFKGHTAISYWVAGRRVWGMTDDGKDIITYYGGSDNNIANVSVYDATGRCVRKLVDEARVPGFYQVVWDGKDDLGQKVPSGSYFCRLSTKNLDGSATTITKKMILLK